MELLSADDVLNKTFQTTKFREGYEIEEVDDFLDLVLGTVRALYAENESLKAEVAAGQARVGELSREVEVAKESTQVPAFEAPAPVIAQPEVFTPVVAPVADVAPAEPEAATGIIQLAQRLHDDHVRAGQEEGERIVSEAKAESSRIVREAEETSSRTLTDLEHKKSVLERKIDELRTFEGEYRDRIRGHLQSLLSDVDGTTQTS